MLHDEALQRPCNLRPSAPPFAKRNVQNLFSHYIETYVHTEMGPAKAHVRIRGPGGVAQVKRRSLRRVR